MQITELRIKRLSLGAEIRIINRITRKLQKSNSQRRTKLDLETQQGLNVDRTKAWSGLGASEMTASQLQSHRDKVVRPEARHAHLAHVFMKGKNYRVAEITCRIPPKTDDIARIVKTFGPSAFKILSEEQRVQKIADWLEG